MNLPTWVLAASLLTTVAQAANARPAVRDWSDADLMFVSVDLYIPNRMIRNAVYNDPAIRSEIVRVGIAAACPAIEDRLSALTRGREDEMRKAMITAIRASFPPTMLRGLVAEGIFTTSFGGRIEKALAKRDPFASMPTVGLRVAQAALATLPTTRSAWRGQFGDWNFERSAGEPYRIACTIEGKPDAAARKRLFDGHFSGLPN